MPESLNSFKKVSNRTEGLLEMAHGRIGNADIIDVGIRVEPAVLVNQAEP